MIVRYHPEVKQDWSMGERWANHSLGKWNMFSFLPKASHMASTHITEFTSTH